VTQAPGESKPHRQIDEVRSGGGYFSQNDLRVHFGLGKAEKVDLLEIRWPSGQIDTIKNIKPNQLLYVKEGEGITRTVEFSKPPQMGVIPKARVFTSAPRDLLGVAPRGDPSLRLKNGCARDDAT
jgi:hypothetical protein